MNGKKIYILDEYTVKAIEDELNVRLAATRQAYLNWRWYASNYYSKERQKASKNFYIETIKTRMYELKMFNRIFHAERD